MEIRKEKQGYSDDIILSKDNLEFKILFGGNGDLYFYLRDRDVNADNYKSYDKNELDFIIDKENMEIYDLFLRLYNDVKNYNFKRKEEDDEDLLLDMNEDRDCYYFSKEVYNKLFHDDIIEWHSDETQYDLADVVKISVEDEIIRVKFIKGEGDEYSFNMPGEMSIRFRNSGSTYTPFNIIFMNFYNNLLDVDLEYHQMHLEEYKLMLEKSTKNS